MNFDYMVNVYCNSFFVKRRDLVELCEKRSPPEPPRRIFDNKIIIEQILPH